MMWREGWILLFTCFLCIGDGSLTETEMHTFFESKKNNIHNPRRQHNNSNSIHSHRKLCKINLSIL